MPKALTIAEKRVKALAKQASATAEKTESVVITKTVEVVNEVTNAVEAIIVKKTRKKRGTFNGTEGKMTVAHMIPGYHLHFINDLDGRLSQAQDIGYEFVTAEEVGGTTNNNVTDRNTDLGDKVRILAGTDKQGNPFFAYLMKQEQSWYDEDQALLQERPDKIDNAIRNGKVVGEGQSSDGFYIPKHDGIKMTIG